MTDSTRLCVLIYGVKTAKTKSRGNVVKGLALIAWLALATAQAQNLASPPTRLPRSGVPGQPTAATQQLQTFPVQQPIRQQIIQASSATDAARYLAGMPVSAESPLTRLTSDPRWIAYSNAMTTAFSKLDQVQLSDIRIWRAEFLAPVTKFSRTCRYFFSGPDFLYADTYYPDCNAYVLVSLEPVESIPPLQSVSLA